jgi:hypothetical protein
VAAEVADDASLEGSFELAYVIGRQLRRLVKLDLAAGLPEHAVEDDEVVVRVDVEGRPEAMKEADAPSWA